MKSRFRTYLLLCAALLFLALALACRGTSTPETVPVTLPTFSPPQSAKPLSAGELEQLNEFSTQHQAITQDWGQFHRDFDLWRIGLTSCGRSSAEKALQDFAVSFNAVTEQARDLSRAEVTRELADSLIAAAEAEETAFRQLRDRWQPNSPSIFEAVEQSRSEAASAQRQVEDKAEELREELDEMTDPGELRTVRELSVALGPISAVWTGIHDDYEVLWRIAADLDDAEIVSRLGGLVERLRSLMNDVDGLPDSDAIEEEIEMLRRAANSESSSLSGLVEAFVKAEEMGPPTNGVPVLPEGDQSVQSIELHLEAMNETIDEAEAILRNTKRTVREILDGSASEDLEEVLSFVSEYEMLRDEWDAFHQQYNEWRRTEGGCDQGEVLQTLGQFKTRIDGIGRRVRDLPQSGYLLSVYNLLVDAADREEGAIRALQNTWQPFTVDAFIAVDRERDNANKLRRDASIALQELRTRAEGYSP